MVQRRLFVSDPRSRTFGVVLFGLVLSLASTATAEDMLSSSDYRWLTGNLNVAPQSLVLQGLTAAQKAHVHALIVNPKLNREIKLRMVADYLAQINYGSFESLLKQSEH